MGPAHLTPDVALADRFPPAYRGTVRATLSPGTVGWFACSEDALPPTLGWLSPAEAARAGAMRFTKRRTEYLLRRWAGKQAVAQVLGLRRDPASLARVEVLNHETGAPYALVDGAPVVAAISLTDRAGWAVCALVPGDIGVGCDLEVAEPRSAGFVADFLTTIEQEYVDSVPDDERDAAANVVWSAKESGLKLLGTGLRRDSRSVQVRAERGSETRGWAPLSVEVDHRRRLAGWWCREGAFVLTVVTAPRTGPPVPLPHSADLRTAEPLHSWKARPAAP